MKDFFVSYTGADVDRATWVAEVLEANNYSVTIQAWDFRAGDNFVSKINEALKECEKQILILSENYLKSKWCEAEWTSKLAEQMRLHDRRIIPVKIEQVTLEGLLAPIVYIDITDKNETEATNEILNGVKDSVPRKSNGYKPNYNIEHVEMDIDYYISDESIVYIKTCKSKVSMGGKNSIHNRITWFPDESVSLSSLTDGVTIKRLDLHDTNINYNVVFNRLLKNGEEVEYRVKAILSNKNRHFDNFVSTEVISPLRNLNIHLNLTSSSVKEIFTQKLSSSPMNSRSESPQKHLYSTPFHWHIANPELHFEYKIYW